jgi:hypothetical protein
VSLSPEKVEEGGICPSTAKKIRVTTVTREVEVLELLDEMDEEESNIIQKRDSPGVGERGGDDSRVEL